ncbi:MAG: hypothetical protein QW520_07340 [Methanomassiliicoccales archaeon]
MFHPERDLRFVILDILKEEGKSISAISRELKERGYDLHRLILTGYLRAMTDLNVLREKNIPPAKIFLASKTKEQTIYEIIGDKVRQLYGEGEKSDKIILFTLNRLFRRAIFSDEMVKAGIKTFPGVEASKEERQQAKQALTRSGFKVPDSLKAYIIDDPEMEKEYTEVLARLLADLFNINYLIKETKQTRLNL